MKNRSDKDSLGLVKIPADACGCPVGSVFKDCEGVYCGTAVVDDCGVGEGNGSACADGKRTKSV